MVCGCADVVWLMVTDGERGEECEKKIPRGFFAGSLSCVRGEKELWVNGGMS